MNLVEGFFGVGAIIGPAIVTSLIANDVSWKWFYVIPGTLCVLLIVMALSVRYPDTRRVPIVVWGARLPRQKYFTVGTDNIKGGELATAHLIDSGRRRIAFFGDTALPEVGHRYEGYLRALKRRSIRFDARLMRLTEFSGGSAARTVDELLKSKLNFDGIFACSESKSPC